MTKLLPHGLLLAALMASPLSAEPAETPHRSVVHTSDLDLATAKVQRLLDRRLAEAVVDACGAAAKVDLAGNNAVRGCRAETRARVSADRQRLIAVVSAPAPIVTAAR